MRIVGLILRLALLASIAVAIFLLYNLGVVPEEVGTVVQAKYLYAALALAGGIWIVRYVAFKLKEVLEPKIGVRVYALTNVVKLVGYTLTILVSIGLLGVGFDVLLVGGAFSGLVIGLAAQPVLGNFFAGILIIATKYVEPGDDVRISTWHIPYQWAFLPGHKFFSPDFIYVGYRGRVVEVGFIYTTIVDENGREVRIPNSIMLDAAVIDYSPTWSKEITYTVRYEFPITMDPDIVLERVKEALSDMRCVTDVYLNEQSEKEFYIVVIKFKVDYASDWRAVKSEILKRLVRVHAKLRSELATH